MNVYELKENFSKLGIEIKIFFTIVLCVGKNGAIKLDKKEVAKYLKVTEQTVGKYIRTFAECKMLKYKYSGEAMLNPDFYYVGAEEERSSVRERYQNFKSDV